MRSGNRIGIVGAGIAGLACAKVLSRAGFSVEVFDRTPDVGGVWSATRRYPGLRAQTSKHTYHFSDHPMPADWPRVPDGQQMQEYLAGYVRRFGFESTLRLRTEVVAADPVDGGWLLEIREGDGIQRTSCDHLVIANGVFSEPYMPYFRGEDAYQAGGGALGHGSQFVDVEAVRDQNVVIVGYGRSACDLAEAVSQVAASTTVLARRLTWKVPRKLAPGVDAERLLLTRTGAAHFRHQEPGRFERFLHGPARSFRESNLDLVQALAAKRLQLGELGLMPPSTIDTIADQSVSVATEGFFEQVAEGRITVRRETTIAELHAGPTGPAAILSDGERIPADIVVCATGFQQRVPFLTPYIQRQLTDDNGNFRLYRHILPLGVPHLSFAGYNSSLISALGAEAAAHWTAALLTGDLTLPSAEAMAEHTDRRLAWLEERTGGRHAHGTAIEPFAIQNLDDLLADMGVKLPRAARAAQWVRPIRPAAYQVLGNRRSSGAPPQNSAPIAQDAYAGDS
ncbi:flavin-containing monooxygenase [Nocardia cyriacigeorgica]|uniref:flavin-containing monooxygenase n=1 Tax=Nocardia cyriacigeorgica TaxID=135487 RepID=UPI000CEA3923|nr:NAD(P)/FAD-dependent oxidoreductase [Nocardia cyriacigeorgica]AVH23097.1 monooxygenase [Nocardia cyriacigeorgica]PPJ16801.1 monooxygenase [Nocardia cyriacigeorgica]